MCLSPWWFFMTINTRSLEDFWLSLYTESLFSLEIGTEINKTLLQPTFVLKWILYVIHYFVLNAPCLIIRSVFLIFVIYRSKVNRSLKNKICFENIYFPSKLIKLCPESLKEHTDKISLRSDETQTFYWSFKYMSNYHLKVWCGKHVEKLLNSIYNELTLRANGYR